MTIQNHEIVTEKEDDDFIVLTKQELVKEVNEKEKHLIILTQHDLKNNEEFEVISVDEDIIKIKNDRLTCTIKHADFKHFDMAYCITTLVSQGSTYDFPYSIYE